MDVLQIHSTREILALQQAGAMTTDNRWIIGSRRRGYLRPRTLIPSGARMMEIVAQEPQDGYLHLQRSEFLTPRAAEIAQFMARRMEGLWGRDFGYFHMARSGLIDTVLENLKQQFNRETSTDVSEAYWAVVIAVEERIRGELDAMEDMLILKHFQFQDEDLLSFPYATEFNGDEGRSWSRIIAGRTLGQLVREAYMGKRTVWVDHPGFYEVYQWAEKIRIRAGATRPVFLTFLVPEIVPGHEPSPRSGIFGVVESAEMRRRGCRV